MRDDSGVSPRFVPATVAELARIGLLAGMPGETLTKLAARMKRLQVAPGEPIVREGESGDLFYVVLSGMLAVSQESMGARGLLQPGDYFGEVALALDIPRTASVRAMTPAVVAGCDKETFEELIRPLFADD